MSSHACCVSIVPYSIIERLTWRSITAQWQYLSFTCAAHGPQSAGLDLLTAASIQQHVVVYKCLTIMLLAASCSCSGRTITSGTSSRSRASTRRPEPQSERLFPSQPSRLHHFGALACADCLERSVLRRHVRVTSQSAEVTRGSGRSMAASGNSRRCHVSASLLYFLGAGCSTPAGRWRSLIWTRLSRIATCRSSFHE